MDVYMNMNIVHVYAFVIVSVCVYVYVGTVHIAIYICIYMSLHVSMDCYLGMCVVLQRLRFAIMCWAEMCLPWQVADIRFCNSVFRAVSPGAILQICALQFFY